MRTSKSPDAGLGNRAKNSIELSYYNVSTTLPFLLKNKRDAVIISPFFETWHFRLVESNEAHRYYSIALPVSLLKKLNQKWSLLFTGIIRKNDSLFGMNMKGQIGGAVLSSHKVTEKLTLKFGAYVNGEYFGLFVMPLAGIDWQINTSDCIFGVLPGNITYQHLLSRKLAYGITFRAQTNSYYRPGRNYTRINENQLGAYLDMYLSKNIVFNLEAGHSLYRNISKKAGPCVNGDCNRKFDDLDVKDHLYLKLALAYRVSLRK
jgi:hypothetical protein